MTSGSPNSNRKPTIYPRYCHDVSPTLPQWCPLRAADVHALKDVGVVLLDDASKGSRMYRVFHHGNHPIKWVKVVGVVVAVDDFPGRKIYTIDDSSGACIECVCIAAPALPDQGVRCLDPKAAVIITKEKGKAGETKEKRTSGGGVDNPTVPWGLIDVGTVVKIKGRIGNFRDMMQVEVASAFVVKTTDAEVRFWNEAGKFKRDVLGHEWAVSKEVEEKLRRRDEKRSKRKRRGKGEAAESKGAEGEKDKGRRRRKGLQEDGDQNAAKRLPEQEKRTRAEGEGRLGKREADLAEEERRRRRGLAEEARTWNRSRSQYPSLEVRRAAAGKYDLLGI